MKLTVLQPCYFPDLVALFRVLLADVVVWADTFLFSKQGTINRTRIKTASGPAWLTIPVLSRGKPKQQIRDVRIDPEHRWRHTHLKSLQVSYRNSPYYYFLSPELEDIINQPYTKLNPLLCNSFMFLCHKIRLSAECVHAQQLPKIRDRSQRVVAWLKETGCETYLLAEEEKQFIDVTAIQQQGWNVQSFSFQHPRYHQLFQTFEPNLSALDVLFNKGELSRTILMNAVKKND